MPRKVVRKSKKVKRKLKRPKRKGTKKKKLSGFFSKRRTKVAPKTGINKKNNFETQLKYLQSIGKIPPSNRNPNLSIFSKKRNNTPQRRTEPKSPVTQNLTMGANPPPLYKRGNRSLPPLPQPSF